MELFDNIQRTDRNWISLATFTDSKVGAQVRGHGASETSAAGVRGWVQWVFNVSHALNLIWRQLQVLAEHATASKLCFLMMNGFFWMNLLVTSSLFNFVCLPAVSISWGVAPGPFRCSAAASEMGMESEEDGFTEAPKSFSFSRDQIFAFSWHLALDWVVHGNKYIETKKFKSICRFLEKSWEIHRLPRLARRPKWLLRIIDHAVDTETSYAVTASTAYSNLPYQNLSKYLNSLHGVYNCLQLYYCTFWRVHISICLG